MENAPVWEEGACIRCGACVGSCPFGAMRLKNWGVSIDQNICRRCYRCILICPVGSITKEESE